MGEKWTESEFIKLEQEERALTDVATLAMLFILFDVKCDLKDELRRFYQEYGKDGIITYSEARKWISEQNHQRRLTALLLFVGSVFTASLGEVETHFRKFLTDVIGKESTFFGVKVDVDKLLSRKWGMDDLTWLDRLEWDVKQWTMYVQFDIKRAIHQRKNIEEVLEHLDTRFGSIQRALERLSLTESTAIGSMSRQDIFKELGVGKYQFYTRADERTCETCGSMHGLIFPISSYEVGVTASPLHPLCRCWEVPIVD